MEEAGFEPAYAKRTDLQSVSFNHSDTPPSQQARYDDWCFNCQQKQLDLDDSFANRRDFHGAGGPDRDIALK